MTRLGFSVSDYFVQKDQYSTNFETFGVLRFLNFWMFNIWLYNRIHFCTLSVILKRNASESLWSISLLIVEDNVRQPDVLTRHVEELDPAVVLGVPGELVVLPLLLHPHVSGQDLAPHVLDTGDSDNSSNENNWGPLTTPITCESFSLMCTVSLSELFATGRISLRNNNNHHKQSSQSSSRPVIVGQQVRVEPLRVGVGSNEANCEKPGQNLKQDRPHCSCNLWR